MISNDPNRDWLKLERVPSRLNRWPGRGARDGWAHREVEDALNGAQLGDEGDDSHRLA